MHEPPGVTVTINRSAAGGFVAQLPGAAGGPIEADSLDSLLDHLRGVLAAAVLTPEERDAERPDDAGAGPGGPVEALPWSEVKARLDDAARPLAAEIACYRTHVAEWGAHEGAHVLIEGGAALGFYPTRDEALAEGYRRFGDAPFLVKLVERNETPRVLERVIR